jgi:hypothetical protein
MRADDESRLNRLVLLYLVLWVLMETTLTVVIGMSDGWPFWVLIGAAAVFVLLFVGLFRLAGGLGRSTDSRRSRHRWTRRDTVLMVILWLTIVIGLMGSHEFKGNLPALALVGLLASLPMTVVACAYVWWWRPRAAARAAAAERVDG